MTPGGMAIMLCTTPLNMRASFDGVARAVQERLGANAKAGRAMYVFINRRKDMAKVLWRDATGWCLLAKRLDARLIEIPANIEAGTASVAIDGRVLATLLDGVECRPKTRHSLIGEARLAADKCISSLHNQPQA